MKRQRLGLDERGQAVTPIFQYVIVVFILGILLYAFAPIISTIWNLNENLPNYDIARPILDLYPIFAIIGITVLFLITRPRQEPSGV